MAATLKTISESLGISMSTVSRVLSGKARQYRISEKTVAVIEKEAERLKFSPNQIASSLRLKKTNTIGLIIPDISNNFFATIARAIEVEARKEGYSIILCDSLGDTDLEIETVHLLLSRNVDGMIVVPVGRNGEHLLKTKESGVPVVLVDRYFENLPLPYISSDNLLGGYEAVKHLIDAGHKKIGCLQGITDSTTSIDRLKGYKKALTEGGLPFEEKLIQGNDFNYESGYKSTLVLLETSPGITAIFAMGNLNALGAMQAFKEKGIEIGRDISLISFDDQPFFSHLSTPLSAVAQQTEVIGKESMKLLKEQIQTSKTSVSRILLKTKLITRESVKDLK